MRVLIRFILGLCLCTVLVAFSGCISRTRNVQSHAAAAIIQTASLDDLVRRINQTSDAIKTINATVEIATSVGGQKKGKVTDYQEIPGYMLLQRPDDIRLIGLVPVVRTRLFDMVSNGQNFSLSIPAKNKFYEGTNQVTKVSSNSLENIRPQAIMNALLLPHIDMQKDIVVLEHSTEQVQDLHDKKKQLEVPTYVLEIISRGPQHYYISHRIVISRSDLRPHTQEIFDTDGSVLTQASYDNYASYDGVFFPNVIRIIRPKEEYEINITVEKLRLNQPLTADQFQLKQPDGSQLVTLQ
jgi:outer membrane lipoprotein-sorting protein